VPLTIGSGPRALQRRRENGSTCCRRSPPRMWFHALPPRMPAAPRMNPKQRLVSKKSTSRNRA
jgi:hypothetical protein